MNRDFIYHQACSRPYMSTALGSRLHLKAFDLEGHLSDAAGALGHEFVVPQEMGWQECGFANSSCLHTLSVCTGPLAETVVMSMVATGPAADLRHVQMCRSPHSAWTEDPRSRVSQVVSLPQQKGHVQSLDLDFEKDYENTGRIKD